MIARPFILLALLLAPTSPASAGPTPATHSSLAMKLTSSAFADSRPIESKFTCDGANVSPALGWTDAPAGTHSFALICDDPDAPAGDWVHWVIYGIPATASGLPEHVATVERLPDGARQGMNDFGRLGYGGPCPPPGKPHRYFFRFYALDVATLPLRPHPRKGDLLQAMQGHILAEARLIGTYQRRH